MNLLRVALICQNVQEIYVKMFYFVSIMIISTFALAQSRQTLSRIGYSRGFCDGQNQYFCIDQLKRDAERDAENSMYYECMAKNGYLESWSKRCFNNCSPIFIPSDSNSVYVNCNSNCQVDCLIRD